MAILPSSAFPHAPAPMLPLAFAFEPADDQDRVLVTEAVQTWGPKWGMPDLIHMVGVAGQLDTVCHAVFGQGLSYTELLTKNAGLSLWHSDVDRFARFERERSGTTQIPDWWDEIPRAMRDNLELQEGDITRTRATGGFSVTPYGSGAHYDDFSVIGWVGSPALDRLVGWGVARDAAMVAIRNIYNKRAFPKWNPNRVIGDRSSLADLNNWLAGNGIPTIGPPPDEQISNKTVIRDIIGSRFPWLGAADVFTDRRIDVLFTMYQVTAVPRSLLMQASETDFNNFLQLAKDVEGAAGNLLARFDTSSVIPESVVFLVRGFRLNGLQPNAIQFQGVEALNEFIMGHGSFWNPLVPLPSSGDWDDPLSNPAVISAMVAHRTGFVIAHDQLGLLFMLYRQTSIPASLVATVTVGEAQVYAHRADLAGNWAGNFVQRVHGLPPNLTAGMEIVSRLFLGGWQMPEGQDITLAEIDKFILDNGLGPILIPRALEIGDGNTSFDWGLPISHLNVINAAIAFFANVDLATPLTLDDVRSIFGTDAPSWKQIHSEINRDIPILPPPPAIPPVTDQAAMESAIAQEITRLLAAEKFGDQLIRMANHWPFIIYDKGQWQIIEGAFRGLITNEVNYLRFTLIPQLKAEYPTRIVELDQFDEWLVEKGIFFTNVANRANRVWRGLF